MARGRRPQGERPRGYRLTLWLYPSRHTALIAYLEQADGLSRAAKVITGLTAALNGGSLTPVSAPEPDFTATLLTAFEGLME